MGKKERLICINPTETRDYEIGGGTFTLGVLPREVFRQLTKVGNDDLGLLMEAVRYGVRGHSNLFFKNGDKVPFNTAKNSNGKKVVADETMDVYAATGVMWELSAEIFTEGGGASVRKRLDTDPSSPADENIDE